MMHLVTGGSGSGKSRYAEQQILDLGPARRIYIATMHPYDDESFARIDRHRKMRAEKQFETMECYTSLRELEIPEDCNILLECMSNLVANEMFEPQGAALHTVNAVLDGVEHLKHHARNLVIVTNEICSDGINYDTTTRLYQEYMGAINQELAHMSDEVTEVVFGIPLKVKTADKSGKEDWQSKPQIQNAESGKIQNAENQNAESEKIQNAEDQNEKPAEKQDSKMIESAELNDSDSAVR